MVENPAINAKTRGERRHHRRIHVLLSATLVSGDRILPALLLDLSTGGARLQLKDRADPTLPMTLRLASGVHFHVETTWHRDREFGLRFDEPAGRVSATLAGLLPSDCLAA